MSNAKGLYCNQLTQLPSVAMIQAMAIQKRHQMEKDGDSDNHSYPQLSTLTSSPTHPSEC